MVMQLVSIGHRVGGVWLRGHDESSPSHWFKFLGTSLKVLMMKLSLPSSIPKDSQTVPILPIGPFLPVIQSLHIVLPPPAAVYLLPAILSYRHVLFCAMWVYLFLAQSRLFHAALGPQYLHALEQISPAAPPQIGSILYLLPVKP